MDCSLLMDPFTKKHILNSYKKFKMCKYLLYFNLLEVGTIQLMSFNDLCIYLNNTNNIDFFTEFINRLLISNKINTKKSVTRKLLSSFMIYYHPDIILNCPSTENTIQKNMYDISKKFIQYLNVFGEACKTNNIFLYDMYIYKLNNTIKKYLECFDTWKKVDKLFLLKDLYERYYEFEQFKNKIKNSAEYKLTLNNIISQQTNIITEINMISKNKTFNINTELDDVFWILLKEELKVSNYKKLISIIENIKNLLYAVVPSRVDIHIEINEIIDTDFIIQNISGKSIDSTYVNKLISYILDKLYSFQSRSDDDSFIKWKETIYSNLNKNINYYEFFPNFLKEVLKRLEKIYTLSKFYKNINKLESI